MSEKKLQIPHLSSNDFWAWINGGSRVPVFPEPYSRLRYEDFEWIAETLYVLKKKIDGQDVLDSARSIEIEDILSEVEGLLQGQTYESAFTESRKFTENLQGHPSKEEPSTYEEHYSQTQRDWHKLMETLVPCLAQIALNMK